MLGPLDLELQVSCPVWVLGTKQEPASELLSHSSSPGYVFTLSLLGRREGKLQELIFINSWYVPGVTLSQWCSPSPVLGSFSTVPHAMVTPTMTLLLLLLHSWNSATAVNHDVNSSGGRGLPQLRATVPLSSLTVF